MRNSITNFAYLHTYLHFHCIALWKFDQTAESNTNINVQCDRSKYLVQHSQKVLLKVRESLTFRADRTQLASWGSQLSLRSTPTISQRRLFSRVLRPVCSQKFHLHVRAWVFFLHESINLCFGSTQRRVRSRMPRNWSLRRVTCGPSENRHQIFSTVLLDATAQKCPSYTTRMVCFIVMWLVIENFVGKI